MSFSFELRKRNVQNFLGPCNPGNLCKTYVLKVKTSGIRLEQQTCGLYAPVEYLKTYSSPESLTKTYMWYACEDRKKWKTILKKCTRAERNVERWNLKPRVLLIFGVHTSVLRVRAGGRVVWHWGSGIIRPLSIHNSVSLSLYTTGEWKEKRENK